MSNMTMGMRMEKNMLTLPGIMTLIMGRCRIICRDLIIVSMYIIAPDIMRFIKNDTISMAFIVYWLLSALSFRFYVDEFSGICFLTCVVSLSYFSSRPR